VRAVLADAIPVETLADHVYVAAALQVHFARLAARLDAAGIPNGPIQTVDQVVADAQTAALGIIQQAGAISLVGVPLSFNGARPPFTKLAPRLGEDNPEIVDPAA